MTSSPADIDTWRALEEAFWRPETRFDRALLEQRLAPEFIEFRRTGAIWSRADILAVPRQPMTARLPLAHFALRPITEDVVQITYVSVATYDGVEDFANRSSIWRRGPNGWQIVFHQSTTTSAIG